MFLAGFSQHKNPGQPPALQAEILILYSPTPTGFKSKAAV